MVKVLGWKMEAGAMQIVVDGHNLMELDSSWYRSQLAVVSQDPRLFSDTVSNNIAYGVTADRVCIMKIHEKNLWSNF
jgi:ATP-binding cassette, subfamily B, bacterial MsbA